MLKVKSFLYSFLWAVAILLLSTLSISTPQTEVLKIPHLDKVVHFSLYFIWTSILMCELSRTSYKRTKANIVWVIAGVTLYGVLMEFLQLTTNPNRTADVWDALFNTLGSIMSVIAYSNIKSFRQLLNFLLYTW